MARTIEKMRGRKESVSYITIPHAVLLHNNYRALSAPAVKLLFDLYGQFRGKNNGDFTAAWTVMRILGWKSRDTLTKALRQLQAYGMIIATRRGGQDRLGRKPATLWAVTFKDIDSCGGKLDISAGPSPGNWRREPDLSLLKPPPKSLRPTRPASTFGTPTVSKPPEVGPVQHARRAVGDAIN